MTPLKAPFPYFGGKSKIASIVWERFGDVKNYVEPFFGSGAVLLARPSFDADDAPLETVNDMDANIANFWRALQSDPEAVAHWADWPVNETDLEARHKWLVRQPGKDEFAQAMKNDPDLFDAKRAGWWVWGLSAWIGGGWCAGEWFGDGNEKNHGSGVCNVAAKRPNLWRGIGVHKKSVGVSKQRPHLGDAGKGVHGKTRRVCLPELFSELSARLRRIRVCCGDWSRVMGPCVTTGHGLTGVFLDPPYGDMNRSDLYAHESYTVAGDVLKWCMENGDNPLLRICLAGYDGEHNALEAAGWSVVAWKTQGGYAHIGNARGRDNAKRERLWFSPACIGNKTDSNQPLLFGNEK